MAWKVSKSINWRNCLAQKFTDDTSIICAKLTRHNILVQHITNHRTFSAHTDCHAKATTIWWECCMMNVLQIHNSTKDMYTKLPGKPVIRSPPCFPNPFPRVHQQLHSFIYYYRLIKTLITRQYTKLPWKKIIKYSSPLCCPNTLCKSSPASSFFYHLWWQTLEEP